jgi:hypothetical protein
VVALLVGCALPVAAGPASATGSVPGSFDLSATAVGVVVQSTQQPASSVVTAGLVDSTVAFSSSSLSSYGTSQSRAAAVYPGDLVAGGPALLCANLFPCPVAPPDYPLLADAAYPSRPSAAAGAAPVGSAQAHAAQHAAQGTAATAATSAAAPVVVRIGSGAVTTHVWVDAGGAHAVSRSALKDLSIGPLRISALEAVDAVDVSAAGVVRDRPRLTLGVVTFNGQSASVDDRGVHVAGQDASAPNQALAAQGLTARLVTTSRQDARGAARSAAAGLLVTFSVPVAGLPQVPGVPSLNRAYVGSALIGGAGAAVAAAELPALDLPQLPPAPRGSATDVVLPGTGARTPDAVALPPLGPGPPAGVTLPQPRLTPVVSWFPLTDLSALALVLMVVPLALLAAWRGGAWLGRRTT